VEPHASVRSTFDFEREGVWLITTQQGRTRAGLHPDQSSYNLFTNSPG